MRLQMALQEAARPERDQQLVAQRPQAAGHAAGQDEDDWLAHRRAAPSSLKQKWIVGLSGGSSDILAAGEALPLATLAASCSSVRSFQPGSSAGNTYLIGARQIAVNPLAWGTRLPPDCPGVDRRCVYSSHAQACQTGARAGRLLLQARPTPRPTTPTWGIPPTPWTTSPSTSTLAKQASALGHAVLELGCGTGRVTIPIARAGVEVVGLDNAPAMLDVARRKAAAAGVDVRWVTADMRSFQLEQRFGLVIIPFRSFLHLLTDADQLACLSAQSTSTCCRAGASR